MWRPLTGILLLSLGTALAQPRVEMLAPPPLPFLDPGRLTVTDLDGDGRTDLVLMPGGSLAEGADPHLYVLRQTGHRTFSAPAMAHLAPLGTGEQLRDAKAVDLWADPGLEIFANRKGPNGSEAVILKPSFAGPVPVTATVVGEHSAHSWSMLDLDGDGIPELVEKSPDAEGDLLLRVHSPQADGAFLRVADIPLVREAQADLVLDALDMDGDGDLDLAVTHSGSLDVFERTGPWAFAPNPAGSEWRMSIADIDGNGRPDFYSSDGWRRNEGALRFSPPIRIQWQFPDEGLPIIRWLEERPGAIAWQHHVWQVDAGLFRHTTFPVDGSGPRISHDIPYDPRQSAIPHLIGDLDGDGHSDVVFTTEIQAGPYHIRTRLHIAWGGAEGFTVTGPWSDTASGPVDSITGDFNADRCTDLILGPLADGHYRLRFNLGAAGLGEQIPLDGLHIPGTSVRILGAQRIDKDRHLDLVCRYTADDSSWLEPRTALVVVRGRGDGSFIRHGLTLADLRWTPSPVVEGDFVDWDRDGDLDLVAFGIWRENRGGTFTVDERFLVDVGMASDMFGNAFAIGGTVTGDLDGDRAPDIISLIHGSEYYLADPEMLVGYNDGFGGIAQVALLPYQVAGMDFLGNPIVLGTANVADMDGDKRPDLWLSVVNGSDRFGNSVARPLWLRNPGRKSRAPSTWARHLLPGNIPPGAPWADFDGNGKLERVTSFATLTPAKRGPVVTPTPALTAPLDLSVMSDAAVGDFDADGDADFILLSRTSSPLLLWNPTGDTRKRNPYLRAPKPKSLRWAGLPAVR